MRMLNNLSDSGNIIFPFGVFLIYQVFYMYFSVKDSNTLESLNKPRKRIATFESRVLNQKELKLLNEMKNGEHRVDDGIVKKGEKTIIFKPYKFPRYFRFNIVVGYIDLSQTDPSIQYQGAIIEFAMWFLIITLCIISLFFFDLSGVNLVNIILPVLMIMIPIAILMTFGSVLKGVSRAERFFKNQKSRL